MYADTKARLYEITFANCESLAKRLSHNGKLGYAPLQRYRKGSPGNPNSRMLVHCFADDILNKYPVDAIAAILPEYEARSRKHRAFVEAAKANTASTTASTETATAIPAIPAWSTGPALLPVDTETETETDTDTDTAPVGSLDAIIHGIIRKEAARAAHNGQAATNANDVARIAKALVDTAIAEAKLPRQTHIVIHKADETGRVETTNMGVQHNQFPRLLALVQKRIAGPTSRRVNVWLPGPAAAGKTTAAENVATALGIPYYYTPAIYDKMDVYGYCTANGDYIATDFFRAYTQGGVYLWDEADSSDPSASVSINAAADGTLASFPHGMFKRHADFVFLAAANTYGMGANEKYVGRNRLDAATLDRFIPLAWGYCPELEKLIVPDELARDTMRRIRKAVSDKQIDVVISTRAGIRHQILRGMEDLYSEAEALEAAYRGGMNADQWRQVTNAAGIHVGTVTELVA